MGSSALCARKNQALSRRRRLTFFTFLEMTTTWRFGNPVRQEFEARRHATVHYRSDTEWGLARIRRRVGMTVCAVDAAYTPQRR